MLKERCKLITSRCQLIRGWRWPCWFRTQSATIAGTAFLPIAIPAQCVTIRLYTPKCSDRCDILKLSLCLWEKNFGAWCETVCPCRVGSWLCWSPWRRRKHYSETQLTERKPTLNSPSKNIGLSQNRMQNKTQEKLNPVYIYIYYIYIYIIYIYIIYILYIYYIYIYYIYYIYIYMEAPWSHRQLSSRQRRQSAGRFLARREGAGRGRCALTRADGPTDAQMVVL